LAGRERAYRGGHQAGKGVERLPKRVPAWIYAKVNEVEGGGGGRCRCQGGKGVGEYSIWVVRSEFATESWELH